MYQCFYRLWNQRQTYAIRGNDRCSWHGNRIIWTCQIVLMDILSDLDSLDNYSSILFCTQQWTVSSTSRHSSWLMLSILGCRTLSLPISQEFLYFLHWLILHYMFSTGFDNKLWSIKYETSAFSSYLEIPYCSSHILSTNLKNSEFRIWNWWNDVMNRFK